MVDVVTEDDARAAEADAEAAESAAAQLASRAPHDDGITLDDVEKAEHAGRLARFLADRARAKAERSKAAAAVQARQALRAEIVAEPSTVTAELGALLDTVSEAAFAFVDRAEAHNAKVRDWGMRAKALGVPDRGVVSPDHEGLGMDIAGGILVDASRVGALDIINVLGLLFRVEQNGLLPNRDGLAAAHRAVDAIGRGLQ